MTELPINQKEYLKKYLGIGKAPGEKKKKKKKPSTLSRIQIIDDDAAATFSNNVTEDDILLANEDAPQIVAIIDERPPSMRVDEKTKNPLWQPIGVVDDKNETQQKQMIKGFKIQARTNDKQLPPADSSPPRRRRRVDNEHSSPPRKSKIISLPDGIVVKTERSSPTPGDSTPPRQNRSVERDLSPPRKRDDDVSPPRRRNKNVGRDLTPPMKRDGSRSQSRINSDISPPRRKRNVEDSSPPRKGRDTARSKSRWSDLSPPQKRPKERDQSPPRKSRDARDESRSRLVHDDDTDDTPRKSKKGDRDISPPRKSTKASKSQSHSGDPSPSGKSNKSSNGKSSRHGLVDASLLVEETRNLQNQQEKLFNALSVEDSGQNSTTVYRDRQTGQIRDFKAEEERQRKKQEEEEKQKEQYAKWGRGLAQVESQAQRIQEQLHEMSKPLARYADDEDLEKYLKEQEREGDPMLAYIRKKRRKKAAESGEVEKPQFEGEFMPNRYGIKPGHRWDGVDRSSGYEKKWFEVQNQKMAVQEDSYKWSTEDM